MKRAFYVGLIVSLFSFFVLSPTHKANGAEAGPFYVGLTGAYLIPAAAEFSGSGIDTKVGFDNDWMLGTRFGYILPSWKYFAAELEFFRFFKANASQTILQTSGADYLKLNDGELSSFDLLANFLLRYPEGKFHPYVGIGLGWAWSYFKGTNVESRGGVTRSLSFDESDGKFAWQALIGLNYEVTREWSVGLGYRYYQTNPKFGDVDVTFSTNMLTLGVNFHF